ncbi:hypothetical protein N7539_005748 [Penicillium diatomitis]|uniref:Uncharacterized protein n=1 Tax=Penicillium diatomitis TaxID=2819901 RepID=A0A9X0BTT7_9EURO|nr:uncharacterized protein N7539_005748 [Penicillium diatomitis]KAJ5483952.1 hypothetical protein N7539_005748 [Penicillium diatomitis]
MNHESRTSHRVQFALHRISDLALKLNEEEPFPRLEWDVALDKFYSLDGLNQPRVPRNTPASLSRVGSFDDLEGLDGISQRRAVSAPHILSSQGPWFDGQSDYDLSRHFNAKQHPSMLRVFQFSADDEASSLSSVVHSPEVSRDVSMDMKAEDQVKKKASPCAQQLAQRSLRPVWREVGGGHSTRRHARKVDHSSWQHRRRNSKSWRGSSYSLLRKIRPTQDLPKNASVRPPTPLSKRSIHPASNSPSSKWEQTNVKAEAGPIPIPRAKTVSRLQSTPPTPKEDVTAVTSSNQASDIVRLILSIHLIWSSGTVIAQAKVIKSIPGGDDATTAVPVIPGLSEDDARSASDSSAGEQLMTYRLVILSGLSDDAIAALYSVMGSTTTFKFVVLLLVVLQAVWLLIRKTMKAGVGRLRRFSPQKTFSQ